MAEQHASKQKVEFVNCDSTHGGGRAPARRWGDEASTVALKKVWLDTSGSDVGERAVHAFIMELVIRVLQRLDHPAPTSSDSTASPPRLRLHTLRRPHQHR
jgi:hypothetical protein